jgi:catalase
LSRPYPRPGCDPISIPEPEELPPRLRRPVDLLANTPEANHARLIFFSDHGTPQGWRNNHGYGCHTFKWVNTDGRFVYIKYHFVAKDGQKQFTD